MEFHFATTDADRAAVAALLPEGNRFAVLLPGTHWETKRWPIEHFAACAEVLKTRLGLGIVIAGGGGDATLAAKVPGLDLCGKTTLRQTVALLERADLVIANDSGPMHIAAALGRPLVTPFGPTNPVRTGPFGRMDTVIQNSIECSPCYSRRCAPGHHRCLKELMPESLVERAMVQLRFTTNPSPER